MCDVSMCMSVQVHLPVESRSVSAVFYHFLHYHPFTFTYFCESRGGNWGENIYIYMHAAANRRGTEDNFGELLSFHCVRSTTSLQMFFFCASGLLSVSPSVLQRGQAPSHDVLPHPKTKISGAK